MTLHHTLQQGYLQKLGGADGGRQNWKKRFFVLQEDLLYFDSQSQYEKGKEPKKRVVKSKPKKK